MSHNNINNNRVKKQQQKKSESPLKPNQITPKVLQSNTTTILNKEKQENDQQHQQQHHKEKIKDDKIKEKSQHNIPPISVGGSIKLLTKSLKVNQQGLEILSKILSRDNDNYMVIGAIGSQSSGKSTILSSLSSNSGNTQSTLPPPFEIQSENNFCLATHQTEGIDVYIDNRDRFIYIDTQPLESMSLLCDLIEKNAFLPNSFVTYEHYHHFQSLKIIVFLMSICNVLLIVQENKSLDLSICKLIRTAMMLKNKIPDISSQSLPSLSSSSSSSSSVNTILSEIEQTDFKAKLLFIFNKITELDYEMNSLDKTLSFLFNNPKDCYLSNLNPIIENFEISEKKTNPISLSTSSSQQQPPIPQTIGSNGILKPNKYYPTFIESTESLKNHIMTLKTTTRFNRNISEREWLENSIKIWDSIQNSDVIDSYCKQLKPLYNIGLSKDNK